jgi:hypothetical protein
VSFVNSDIPSVDLRSALDGIGRRWWLVVLSVAVTIGVVFSQDSGLVGSSEEQIVVDRTYEAVIDTDELDIVKIDPSAITPVPSFENQVELLESDEVLTSLQEQTGIKASLDITRSEPKFTITDSLDELNNRVTFLSSGTPAYSFRCVGNSEADCDTILDSYVQLTIDRRKESILGGLNGGLGLLDSLISKGQERLVDGSLDEQQRDAQRIEIASLMTKRDALKKASSNVSGELMLVVKDAFVQGKTTSSVTASTYGFGLGVGLIVGLLLTLQLAALDKTVRNPWQIRRINPSLQILGSPVARSDDAQLTALAAALESSRIQGATSAILHVLDDSLMDFASGVLARAPHVKGVVSGPGSSATVDQIAGGSARSLIVLVKAGRTTRSELSEALGLLTAGGNRLLGVALIS